MSGWTPYPHPEGVALVLYASGTLFAQRALDPRVTDRGNERISPHGYSATPDERLYLQALCEGPKLPANIANELADDLAESGDLATELAPNPSRGPHRAPTVADRLAFPVDYEGTEHLVERDGDLFVLTDAG